MIRLVIGFLGGILLVAVTAGLVIGYWVFQHVDARLLLSDQPAVIRVPEPVDVSARVLDDLDIEINDSITTTVPINQTISVPLNDTLHVQADFDSSVPIALTVPVHDKIRIDQVLDIDTTVKAEMLGDTHDMVIRGKVPVSAVVPVNLSIPVDQQVHIKFSAPVDVRLRQPLSVPLKASIAATIPIHSRMSVPVKSTLRAQISIPKPADIVIVKSDLDLPLRTLRVNADVPWPWQRKNPTGVSTSPPGQAPP